MIIVPLGKIQRSKMNKAWFFSLSKLKFNGPKFRLSYVVVLQFSELPGDI